MLRMSDPSHGNEADTGRLRRAPPRRVQRGNTPTPTPQNQQAAAGLGPGATVQIPRDPNAGLPAGPNISARRTNVGPRAHIRQGPNPNAAPATTRPPIAQAQLTLAGAGVAPPQQSNRPSRIPVPIRPAQASMYPSTSGPPPTRIPHPDGGSRGAERVYRPTLRASESRIGSASF